MVCVVIRTGLQTLEPMAEYIEAQPGELLLLNLASNTGPRQTGSCQVENQSTTAVIITFSFEIFFTLDVTSETLNSVRGSLEHHPFGKALLGH